MASGVPITLNSGELSRIAETDTLNAGTIERTDSSALVVRAASGQTTQIGRAGDTTEILGTPYVYGEAADSRYYTQSSFLAASAGAGDAGKPVELDADGNIDATMINDADVSHNSTSGLQGGGSGDYYHLSGSQYTGLDPSLDDCYDNDSGARNIEVDAGNVSWDLDAGYSFIWDLTSTTTGGEHGVKLFAKGEVSDYYALKWSRTSTLNYDWYTKFYTMECQVLGGGYTLNSQGTIDIDGGVGVDITAGTDLTLGARSATIALNQSGDTALSGFTATSIVGALNELKGSIGDVGVWSETADETITQYAVVSADDGATSGTIVEANKDSAGQNFVIGVAQAAGTAGNPLNIKSSGKSTVLTSDVGAWTVGQEVYMSDTDGEVTGTAPTSGVSQRVGYSLDTGTGSSRSAVISLGEPVVL
jgi:hypothetical protein